MVGAGHDISSLTIKNMFSISLNFSTNTNKEAQNPRRDTSIPSVSAIFIFFGGGHNDVKKGPNSYISSHLYH